MRIRPIILALLSLLAPLAVAAGADTGEPVTVFVAKKIITMDATRPEATHVAVADGRILAVGGPRDMAPWITDRPHVVDERFRSKYLMPGLIDPHLHPYIGALLLPMDFVTPHAWTLPGQSVEGVRGHDAYVARLHSLEAEKQDETGWLMTWGYHHLYHGPISRSDLDAISSTRPILVWHRSFHEVYMNSAALEILELRAENGDAAPHGVDYENGHFWELGMRLALSRLAPILLAPAHYQRGLALTRQAIHAGGITSIMDGAFGTLDLETEWRALQAWETDDLPFRVVLLPDGRALGEELGHQRAMQVIEQLPERSSEHLIFPTKSVKLFSDGAFYSQLMQMGPPGYLDGHSGEWLMQPAELLTAARVYWNAGYQINVHANGDRGIDAALDVLERLQGERPRLDHRYALHHFGYSTPEQAERLAALGGIVSANPYYLWALGDLYAKHGLGPERASQMVRLGALHRSGVRFSLHSDFTMAPASPLRLAQVAASRRTAEGNVMAPRERVPIPVALRAITLDAAHLMKMEDEIGSIRAGKRADFTVLERNPIDTKADELGEIPIWGTVFGGRIFPARP
jgi:predicted amidohydrolase YtcJ